MAPFGRFHLWDKSEYNYVQYDSTQNKWVTFIVPDAGPTEMSLLVETLHKKLSFSDVYTFPLKVMNSTRSVYDSEGVFVFHVFDGIDVNSLLDIINGEVEPKNKQRIVTYENGKITMNENGNVKDVLLIRGWGYLTGEGGLNLSDEQAAQVQDEMGKHLVEILNHKTNG